MTPPHFDHVHMAVIEPTYKYKLLAWDGKELFYIYVTEHETMDMVYRRERRINPAYHKPKATEIDHARFSFRLLFGLIGEKIRKVVKG